MHHRCAASTSPRLCAWRGPGETAWTRHQTHTHQQFPLCVQSRACSNRKLHSPWHATRKYVVCYREEKHSTTKHHNALIQITAFPLSLVSHIYHESFLHKYAKAKTEGRLWPFYDISEWDWWWRAMLSNCLSKGTVNNQFMFPSVRTRRALSIERVGASVPLPCAW